MTKDIKVIGTLEAFTIAEQKIVDAINHCYYCLINNNAFLQLIDIRNWNINKKVVVLKI